MYLRLKVVKGNPRGHCLLFPNGEFIFGRGPECDLRPNSDLVSRQHCLLQITDQTALIRDLASRNGTLINGELVPGERLLAHGDTIQLGPLVLEVLLDPEATEENKAIRDTAVMNQDDTAKQQPHPSDTCESAGELTVESLT
jgi:pSer/pThr/pTyr-binding forkhead associated (FHA) protein